MIARVNRNDRPLLFESEKVTSVIKGPSDSSEGDLNPTTAMLENFQRTGVVTSQAPSIVIFSIPSPPRSIIHLYTDLTAPCAMKPAPAPNKTKFPNEFNKFDSLATLHQVTSCVHRPSTVYFSSAVSIHHGGIESYFHSISSPRGPINTAEDSGSFLRATVAVNSAPFVIGPS